MIAESDRFLSDRFIQALFRYKVTRHKKDADQEEDQGHSAKDDEFSAGVPGEILIADLAPIASFSSFNKLRISCVLVAPINVFSSVFAAAAFHDQWRGVVMFPSHLPEFLVSTRRSIASPASGHTTDG